ncbi:hypothetical protein [uncultured Alistipes sp.]|jgi:hypothetical protein|uniref:hypothetical protein n=1 Tax=uncultured Alistipes sp. TaxID=538949 RepID=UPI0025CE01FA|nr:hypothetical protein [uncultured Alistipes sp.]
MKFDSEWLSKEQEDAFGMDQLITFLRYNSWWLLLYKHTRWDWLGKMICRMEFFQFQRVKELTATHSYQETLLSYIQDIEQNILPTLNLRHISQIEEYGDIGGFNFFNACAFPCFGVNFIAMNSGIFFHSHTLVRTLQPFLMHKTGQTSLPHFMRNFFNRYYKKVAIGFLTNDRTRSFMSIRFIPEDDNLLYGIEYFIAAHEYAHILFRDNDYSDFKFADYFTKKQLDLIYSNEEIAADAAALIILKKSFDKIGSFNVLYAPCFIFHLFACFDEMMEIRQKPEGNKMPDAHPSNSIRHDYIIDMLNTLYPNSLYEKYDHEISHIVTSNGKVVKKKVLSIVRKRHTLLEIYKEMHYRVRDITS